MFSSISIRFNSKTKVVKWKKPMVLEDFTYLVASMFAIKDSYVCGLKDKLGNVYNFDYFLNNPEMIKKEAYLLITKPKPKGERLLLLDSDKGSLFKSTINEFKTPPKKIESSLTTATQEIKVSTAKTQTTVKKKNQTEHELEFRKKISKISENCFRVYYIQKDSILISNEGQEWKSELLSILLSFSSFEAALDFFSSSKWLLTKYQEKFIYYYSINSSAIMKAPSLGIFLKNIKLLEMQLVSNPVDVEKIFKAFLNNFIIPDAEESIYDIEQSSVRSYYQIPELSLERLSTNRTKDRLDDFDSVGSANKEENKKGGEIMVEEHYAEEHSEPIEIDIEAGSVQEEKNAIPVQNKDISLIAKPHDTFAPNSSMYSTTVTIEPNRELKENDLNGMQAKPQGDLDGIKSKNSYFLKKTKNKALNKNGNEHQTVPSESINNGQIQEELAKIEMQITKISAVTLENLKYEEETREESPSNRFKNFYVLLYDFNDKVEAAYYGMAINLFKNRDSGLLSILHACQIQSIPRYEQFNSILEYSQNAFASHLEKNFSHEEISIINTEKKISNSSIDTILQCFYFDNDLEELTRSFKLYLKKKKNPPNTEGNNLDKKPSLDEDKLSQMKSDFQGRLSSVFNNEDNKMKCIEEEDSYCISDHLSPVFVNGVNFSKGIVSARDKNHSEGSNSKFGNKSHREHAEKRGDKERRKYSELAEWRKSVSEAKSLKKTLIIVRKDSCSPKSERRSSRDSIIRQYNQTILDKFYENDDLGLYEDIFKRMLSRIDFLSERDLVNLRFLLDNHNPEILDILNQFNKHIPVKQLKPKIIKAANMSSFIFSTSPRGKQRIKKLHSFKLNLDEIHKAGYLSYIQVKMLEYLFIHDEFALLGAFEVFQVTGDIKEFLDTLQLIYKIQFFRLEDDVHTLEEIDEKADQQMKILYVYKNTLSRDTFSTLERAVRYGERSLLDIHKEYMENKDKELFSDKLNALAVKLKEAIINKGQNARSMTMEEIQMEMIEDRKSEINLYKAQNFLKEIAHIEFLYELVDSQNSCIHGIFETFKLTRDKQDFVENLNLIYIQAYKEKMRRLIEKYGKIKKWDHEKYKLSELALKSKNKLIFGAFELVLCSGDEDDELEFIDTLEKFINLQKKS